MYCQQRNSYSKKFQIIMSVADFVLEFVRGRMRSFSLRSWEIQCKGIFPWEAFVQKDRGLRSYKLPGGTGNETCGKQSTECLVNALISSTNMQTPRKIPCCPRAQNQCQRFSGPLRTGLRLASIQPFLNLLLVWLSMIKGFFLSTMG